MLEGCKVGMFLAGKIIVDVEVGSQKKTFILPNCTTFQPCNITIKSSLQLPAINRKRR